MFFSKIYKCSKTGLQNRNRGQLEFKVNPPTSWSYLTDLRKLAEILFDMISCQNVFVCVTTLETPTLQSPDPPLPTQQFHPSPPLFSSRPAPLAAPRALSCQTATSNFLRLPQALKPDTPPSPPPSHRTRSTSFTVTPGSLPSHLTPYLQNHPPSTSSQTFTSHFPI